MDHFDAWFAATYPACLDPAVRAAAFAAWDESMRQAINAALAHLSTFEMRCRSDNPGLVWRDIVAKVQEVYRP